MCIFLSITHTFKKFENLHLKISIFWVSYKINGHHTYNMGWEFLKVGLKQWQLKIVIYHILFVLFLFLPEESFLPFFQIFQLFLVIHHYCLLISDFLTVSILQFFKFQLSLNFNLFLWIAFSNFWVTCDCLFL